MKRISESKPMERKSKPERNKTEQERRGKTPECERKGERLKYEKENKIFIFMFTIVNRQVVQFIFMFTTVNSQVGIT